MPRRYNTPAEFWSHVQRTDLFGCWEWIGKPNKNGYCESVFRGERRYAHRVAYALTFPEWDGKDFVLHRCDNPRCVNPAHLFHGSQKDNVDDMRAKGRARGAPRGSLHPSAKLAPTQVLEIRTSRLGCVRLARQYGVTKAHITQIKSGLKWGHLPQEGPVPQDP